MATLLLPVGPPGSGKTFLGMKLKDKYKDKLIYLSRDDIFIKFREGNSIRNSKHYTHKFIQQELQKYKDKNVIVYIDTTNSNYGIRDLYESYLTPIKVKYICFKYDISILIKRISNREHPTFPKDNIKQLITLNKINRSIQYPSENCIEINQEHYDIDKLFNF